MAFQGSIHAKAKAAGMSVEEYAEKHKDGQSPVSKQARLYKAMTNLGSKQPAAAGADNPEEERKERLPPPMSMGNRLYPAG